MTPLFEAELEYVTDMAPVVPAESREGDYIGSGTGRVRGTLKGSARGSMFAADCAYLLVKAGVDPAYIGVVRDTLVPNGDLWAGLTICGEMTFGVLLAVGLLTPIASVGSMWQSLNYILVKGAFVHGAYVDKTFFMVAAVLFLTAAGRHYGIDTSLSKVVPTRIGEWFMGLPAAADEGERQREQQPTPAPA